MGNKYVVIVSFDSRGSRQKVAKKLTLENLFSLVEVSPERSRMGEKKQINKLNSSRIVKRNPRASGGKLRHHLVGITSVLHEQFSLFRNSILLIDGKTKIFILYFGFFCITFLLLKKSNEKSLERACAHTHAH